jgi:hypothetical protein
MLMDEPMYPSVQGQAMPDLGLARYGIVDNHALPPATDSSTAPLDCAPPPLQRGDIAGMGLDPTVPAIDLQLANAFTVPDPAQLAAPTPRGAVNPPTFTLPEMDTPRLANGDLTGPGIAWLPGFAPDPSLPDLLSYPHPTGLEIVAASSQPLITDPLYPDLTMYDQPAGLTMPGPLMPDPTLPDLESPILQQAVHMPDRPGDLAGDALAQMHADPTFAQLPAQDYQDLWMQQQGQTTHRERRQGMMMLGLDQEEHDA